MYFFFDRYMMRAFKEQVLNVVYLCVKSKILKIIRV